MKKINFETELRFLVKGTEWKKLGRGTEIWQGFISTHHKRVVRVRIFGEAAFLTIKGQKVGDDNPEFEWPISKEEAIEMFQTPNLMEGFSIRKVRYKIPFASADPWIELTWEVDEFLEENESLRIAEIELTGISNEEEKKELKQSILGNLPTWIGKRLDFQSDPDAARYFNNELAKRPFAHWNEEEKADMMSHH